MKTHKGVEVQLYSLLTFWGRCIHSHKKIQQLTFRWSQSYLVYWLKHGLEIWCLISSWGKRFLYPKPACSGTHHDSHLGTRVLSLEVKERPFQPGISRNITCCITPFRSHLSRDNRATERVCSVTVTYRHLLLLFSEPRMTFLHVQ